MSPDFTDLPTAVADAARRAWERLCSEQPERAARLADQPELLASLPRVWGVSEFVAGSCLRYPEDLSALLEDGELLTAWTPGSLPPLLKAGPEDGREEAEVMTGLRRFRRRQMIRVAWRHLAGWAELEENLGHISELAETCIRFAVDAAQATLSEAHGRPEDKTGQPMDLLVLAMGKLGGGELNFSSDVDLIFLFEGSGETTGRRPLSHEQYFLRLGQRVIRLLDESTADGQVFRVDMRLRPFGQSGPLAMSLPAFQAYLEGHGRPWERYAYVKARPLTGWSRGMGLYREILQPFVYRRYLDFGLLESLREMKAKVAAEVARRDMHGNIKLGPGGIREIEFIVQSVQLLRGGTDRRLCQPGLLPVLARIRALGYLEDKAGEDLEAAYRFLRGLENRLQAMRDEQTHDLPRSEANRSRLAVAMGRPDWETLESELLDHRAKVERCFHAHVAPDAPEPPATGGPWPPGEQAGAALEALGYPDAQAGARLLAEIANARWVGQLDETGRQRLDELVPSLVRDAADLEDPLGGLARLLRVLTAIGRRSAYFALLNENRTARERLVSLCSRSDFLVEQVALHPLLLDELIDPRLTPRERDRERLESELSDRLDGVEDTDLEGQMESLRNFQRAAVFSTAVADLAGALPVMKVSDRLSDIAEVILKQSTRLARAQMEHRYGRPLCGEAGALREAGFAVIGYGKLGGIELGYGSDLDLVFMHDSSGSVQETDGESSLDCAVFFARMTRRLVHLLSTQTGSGVLYEVDTRLRPSGKGGLLVSTLSSFEDYQRGQAWTWEHQALLRARAVAGDAQVMQAFEALRIRILRECVDRNGLRERVAEMRDRMRTELSRGTRDTFDLKQDRGGITDIEFLVQYWVLRWAADDASLVRWSDNVRQLEALAESGRVGASVTQRLMEAYLTYRRRLHHGVLAGEDGLIPAGELTDERAWVAALWQEIMAPRNAAG